MAKNALDPGFKKIKYNTITFILSKQIKIATGLVAGHNAQLQLA